VAVMNHAGAPVTGRRLRNLQLARLKALPALQLNNLAEIDIADEILRVARKNDARRPPSSATRMPDNPPQRGAVQVIHVGVRDQHPIHRRQTRQLDAGTPQALDQHQPVREIRVDQQRLSAELEQKRGVADKGQSEVAAMRS